MADRIITNILPHIDAYVRTNADGDFSFYQIYPHTINRGYDTDYVLHIPSGDYTGTDPEGNEIYEPYYTWGGATVIDESYDWATNPDGYEAIPYEESMIVLGDVKPPHETI